MLWINSQNFMQGKGFEPSDSFETGYLIEPLLMISDLKSCAVGQAWLPLQMKKTRMPDHMRTPGLEPGQKAWKALIITARSHPQIDRLNIFPVFVIYDDSHKCNIIAIKMTIRKIKISITGSFAYSWIT